MRGQGTPSRSKSGKFPSLISDSGVAAKIYRSPRTVGGKVYDAFTPAYSLGGKRMRKAFADPGEAEAEAARIVAQMAQGSVGAARLTGDERAGLQAALTKLAKIRGNQNASV